MKASRDKTNSQVGMSANALFGTAAPRAMSKEVSPGMSCRVTKGVARRTPSARVASTMTTAAVATTFSGGQAGTREESY